MNRIDEGAFRREPDEGDNGKVTGAEREVVIERLTQQLFAISKAGRLNSHDGSQLLSTIEDQLSPSERERVVNARGIESKFGIDASSQGVLELHRQRMTPQLLTRLLALGLDLYARFPFTVTSGSEKITLTECTVYHAAAIHGNSSLLQILPALTPLVNSQTSSGETPIVAAFKFNQNTAEATEVVNRLLDKGADTTIRDSHNRHLFHYAIPHCGIKLFRRLREEWPEDPTYVVSREEVKSALLRLAVESNNKTSLMRRLEGMLGQLREEHLPRESSVPGTLMAFSKFTHGEVREHHHKGNETTFTELSVVLRRISKLSVVVGSERIKALVNAIIPSKEMALLPLVFTRGAGPSIVKQLLDLGADPTSQVYIPYDTNRSIPGRTILHDAIYQGDFEFAEKIITRMPMLAGLPDSEGNFPAHLLLSKLISSSPYEVPTPINLFSLLLLSESDVIGRPNVHSQRLIDLALAAGRIELLKILQEVGSPPPPRDSERTFTIFNEVGELQSTDYAGLLTETLRLHEEMAVTSDETNGEFLLNSICSLIRDSRSVYPAYLILLSAMEALEMDVSRRKSIEAAEPLIELTPYLLFNLPQGSADGLWTVIETHSDRFSKIQRLQFHANEAEMMLLLNHVKEITPRPEILDPLTRALTATTRIISKSSTVSHSVVWNLARVGVYTHGFHKLLQHDCTRCISLNAEGNRIEFSKPLIVNRLHAEEIYDDDPGMAKFGKGFRIIPTIMGEEFSATLPSRHQPYAEEGRILYSKYHLDPRTYFVFRQGTILAAHPLHGILLIRNSGLEFGRDLLQHPAYWSPLALGRGIGAQECDYLSKNLIHRSFQHLLKRDLVLDDDAQKSIYFLIRQLDILRDVNRRRKFSTGFDEAFEIDKVKGEGYILKNDGAYRSPWFGQIVRKLRGSYEAREFELRKFGRSRIVVPSLGFVHRSLPPHQPYRFVGTEGRMQGRLEINPDTLAVLEGFVTGKFTRRLQALDEQYGISRCWQEAGFATGGELVLLTPLNRT
jgi:ankyrin repeat protein